MPAPANRRTFLQGSAAAAAFTIVAPHVLGGPKFVAPSDRVNVALVGAGGRGLQNARELMKLDDVRITAVVDPAEHWDLSPFYYKGVAGRLPAVVEIERHYGKAEPGFRCAQFLDFRRMLDESSDVDAVLCATPDHSHAVISVAAMKAGKHAYCEKPLTHNIYEARLAARVAEETGVATQMGNQGHSTDGIRETVELLRAGVIGEIEKVHAWVPAVRWNPTLTGLPNDADPVPAGLDWDLWCGPRPVVPFNEAFAPVSWRDFWMFGCGALGDFGCHDLDSSVWGLELDQPTEVQFFPAGRVDNQTAPYGEVGYYIFPSKYGRDGAVKIHWYSGGLRPMRPDQLPQGKELPARGVLFEGTDGIMVCGGAGGKPQLFPESLTEAASKVEPSIPRSKGHHRDWIDAIKGGPPASSNFAYGAKLTEITLLGLLSLRTGGSLIRWDAAAMAAPGVEGAEQIIHGVYREGWKPTA